jgi:N-glycosylase/DNA lyase
VRLDKIPFNLDVTLCCGQVFRWEKKGSWWYGIVGEKPLKVRQTKTELEFAGADQNLLMHYFSLDEDLERIGSEIGRDKHIRRALSKFWGLRLTRQEPWECLISYICATYKNIPSIRSMILNLSRRFGEKKFLDGCEFFTFPTPKALAFAEENSLARCGLGYRAKYILATSKRIFENDFELENLRKMPYEQAKIQLCHLAGVGPKVADCVLLFSLGKTEAFPVDRWVKRVILNHYAQQLPPKLLQKLDEGKELTSSGYAKLNAFGRKYFGEYAGYAQEYLYHYERVQT